MLRVETVPYGLGVGLEDQPRAGGFSVESVVGLQRILGAFSPQNIDDLSYKFVSWFDGDAAVHNILTPPKDTTYRATFWSSNIDSVPVSDYFRSEQLNANLWSFVNIVGDCAAHLTSSGTIITLPAGTSHDIWTKGNNPARLLQSVPNVDFGAEVKFDSAVTVAYQDQACSSSKTVLTSCDYMYTTMWLK